MVSLMVSQDAQRRTTTDIEKMSDRGQGEVNKQAKTYFFCLAHTIDD